MTTWAAAFGATTSTSDVTVAAGMTVTIDGTVTARKVTIDAGGVLEFTAAETGHLHAYGSIINNGVLRMRPASAAITHDITFEGVNEANYVGGGMHDPVLMESDIGLWTLNDGKADLAGTFRTAWGRATGSLLTDANTVTLTDTPSGWRVGDKIVISPTADPTVPGYSTQFEEVTVTGVTGATVTFTPALQHDHPAMVLSSTPTGWTMGTTFGAEVLNLTRNVRIQGTPSGRAHISFVHLGGHATPPPAVPQTISDVEISFMGPQQQVTPGSYEVVLARYALHFHHCTDGSRGSTVNRVVAHDLGSRAFVTHASHGITLADCVAYRHTREAFWWDKEMPEDASNDILWTRTVAAWGLTPPGGTGLHRVGQYQLGDGQNLTLTDSVAVGGGGMTDSSGYHWPEGTSAVWTFERNIAHNHARAGIFVWHNNADTHTIDQYLGYYNDRGIDHGAYRNVYQYHHCTLVGNTYSNLRVHSSSNGGRRATFDDFAIDGRGISKYALEVRLPNLIGQIDTNFERIAVKGVTDRVVYVTTDGPGVFPQTFQLRYWTIDPAITQAQWLLWQSGGHVDTVMKFRFWNGTADMFNTYAPENPVGTLNADWNAYQQTVLVDDFVAGDYGTPTTSETFTGADGAQWPSPRWVTNDAATTAVVQLSGNAGLMQFASSLSASATAYTTDVGLGEVSMRARARFADNTARGFLYAYLRCAVVGGAASSGYRLKFANDTSTVTLERLDPDGAVTALGSFTNGYRTNVTDGFWFRFETQGSKIRARVWAFGTTEPASWATAESIEVTDTTYTTGQTFFAYLRSGGTHTVYLDDIDWWDLFVPPKVALEPVRADLTVASPSVTIAVTMTDGSVKTVTPTESASWLTVTPASAATPATFTVTADPAGLAADTYTTDVTFDAGANTIPEQLPTTFTVPSLVPAALWPARANLIGA